MRSPVTRSSRHGAAILARTRAILNRNYPIIAEWLDAQGGLFSYAPPDAARSSTRATTIRSTQPSS